MNDEQNPADSAAPESVSLPILNGASLDKRHEEAAAFLDRNAAEIVAAIADEERANASASVPTIGTVINGGGWTPLPEDDENMGAEGGATNETTFARGDGQTSPTADEQDKGTPVDASDPEEDRIASLMMEEGGIQILVAASRLVYSSTEGLAIGMLEIPAELKAAIVLVRAVGLAIEEGATTIDMSAFRESNRLEFGEDEDAEEPAEPVEPATPDYDEGELLPWKPKTVSGWKSGSPIG